MRRTVVLALAFALAGCGEAAEEQPVPPPRAAEPQRADVGWRETYPGPGGEHLVFAVETLEVTAQGWTADVAVTNATKIPFAARPAVGESRYGLMLFATGDLAELDDANRAGRLPAVRRATEIEPAPPTVLAPGTTWRARLSAPGSLSAGSYVRVVFGPLRAQGEPPDGIEEIVTWITDRSYRLGT